MCAARAINLPQLKSDREMLLHEDLICRLLISIRRARKWKKRDRLSFFASDCSSSSANSWHFKFVSPFVNWNCWDRRVTDLRVSSAWHHLLIPSQHKPTIVVLNDMPSFITFSQCSIHSFIHRSQWIYRLSCETMNHLLLFICLFHSLLIE